jgi:hypothetical protein
MVLIVANAALTSLLCTMKVASLVVEMISLMGTPAEAICLKKK